MTEEHKLEMQELQKDIVRQQREKWYVIWQSLGKTRKEKNKTITGIKVKLEKAPERLTAAKNTAGNIAGTNGRWGWRMEWGKTNEIQQKKELKG